MMANERSVSLQLPRGNVCRLMSAVTHICIEYREEIRNPETTHERRNICCSSLRMWQDLHDELERQLDEHDRQTTATRSTESFPPTIG